MTELLEAGTEATVCLMPSGSDMNGARGVVVCYNQSSGRYTLELESGEMMSLRAKNLKLIHQEEGEEETKETEEPNERVDVSTVSSFSSNEESERCLVDNESIKSKEKKELKKMPKSIKKNDGNIESKEDSMDDDESIEYVTPLEVNDLVIHTNRRGKTHTAVVLRVTIVNGAPRYLIRLENGVELQTTRESLSRPNGYVDSPENRNEGRNAAVHQPNIFDTFLLQVYTTVTNFSPSSIFFALLAIYCYFNWTISGSNTSSNSTPPRDDYYYRPWHYGWYGYGWWHYGYGWYGLGGLGSFLLMGFIMRKLGTNDGRRAFSWDRAWDRLMRMDIWELIRLAAIFEIALHFLGGMGGRRYRRY